MTRAFRTHVSALVLTKTADGVIDPKLVLAWLLNAIGAPGYLVGFLVPVREAGALLPQLLLARSIEKSARQKWFWVAGSVGQGLAALAIALAAFTLSGAVAGWAILAALALLAVARSACSASFKGVLAATVEKGERGRVSGLAGTISAAVVFAFAIALSLGLWPREPDAIALATALAGVFWLIGAGVFASLDEPRGEGAEEGGAGLSGLVAPLREDREFQTYLATRALLIATALAPPFLVLLGNAGRAGADASGLGQAELGNLGALIVASSLAAILSSYIWGALADRSSRQTLMLSGLVSAAALLAGAAAGAFGWVEAGGLLVPALLFVSQIAYEGARAGRKTHLTDMDTEGRKAVYTALSNTVIGAMLVLGGLFGLLADAAGPQAALLALGSLSAVAVFAAYRLSEVQAEAE